MTIAITTKSQIGMVILVVLLLTGGWGHAQEAEPRTLKVNIEGLKDKLQNNVEAYLEINQLANEPVPSESRLRWLHGRAEENIRRALQPFGYYKPSIEGSLEKTAEHWVARYRVETGPPIRLHEVDVKIKGDGNDDPAFNRVLTNLPLRQGQVLEHPRYEEIKQSFQNLAAERGYFDARFEESQIRIDLDAYRAAIVLHFNTGERYRFGQIQFHQDALAPEFLRRYLEFESGDPYRVSSLLTLQTNLINSNYFSQVELGASPDKAVDHTIPVDVQLDPKTKTQYTFGIGYGTDTGVRGRAGVERPLANRWGHRYQAELRLSQIKTGLAAQYTIPGSNPLTDSFSLRANYTEEDSDTKDTSTATIGISHQRQKGKWFRIASLNYQREIFTFSGVEETTQLLYPELDWTRVDADDRLYTTEGNLLSLRLRGAYEGLVSDVSFVQAAARAKWIESLNEKHRLLLRGELGTTVIEDDDFNDLPASLRYYAGGDRSVRGYSLDSIGPRNEEGDVIGGKHLIVGSLEYDYRIREKWSLAAFVDSGDAFDDSPDMKTGVGVGLRWLSPVGPVRIDLASGLDEPGDTIRLHLNIGPDL